MINSDSITKFKESLANFIESGDDELLNWFIRLDKEYKTNLLNSDVFLTKFGNAFVRNSSQNVDIFNYLVDSSSKDTRNQIGRLFSSLIETKQQSQYSKLLTLLIEKYSEWPIEIVTLVQDACISIGLQIGPPHDVELLNTAFLTLQTISNEQLQKISTIMIPQLVNPDASIQDNASRLLKLVSEKSDKVEAIIIQKCAENARELLAEGNVNVKALLDYLISYPEKKLNLTQINQIIDLIREQLKTEKPQPIVLVALEFIPKIISNLNRAEILETIIGFIETVSDEVIKERCKNILIQFASKLTTPAQKKTNKIFGYDVFKKP